MFGAQAVERTAFPNLDNRARRMLEYGCSCKETAHGGGGAAMPICLCCSQAFSNWQRVEGQPRNLQNRQYCLACSPFGSRNTRQLHKVKPGEKNCRNCDRRVEPQYDYCSNACQVERQYRDWVDRWLVGEETGVRSDGKTSLMIRRYLIETRGEVCETCGWNERHPVTGKVPITVHHVDGDSDNNRPENLLILCPNHHSLTPTYGNLNRGKGKRKRK